MIAAALSTPERVDTIWFVFYVISRRRRLHKFKIIVTLNLLMQNYFNTLMLTFVDIHLKSVKYFTNNYLNKQLKTTLKPIKTGQKEA